MIKQLISWSEVIFRIKIVLILTDELIFVTVKIEITISTVQFDFYLNLNHFISSVYFIYGSQTFMKNDD